MSATHWSIVLLPVSQNFLVPLHPVSSSAVVINAVNGHCHFQNELSCSLEIRAVLLVRIVLLKIVYRTCLGGSVADSIKPQDLGLGTIDQHNRGLGDDGKEKCRPILSRYVPVISYLHLYECDLFSVRAGT